jgi:hypothetical protein
MVDQIEIFRRIYKLIKLIISYSDQSRRRWRIRTMPFVENSQPVTAVPFCGQRGQLV